MGYDSYLLSARWARVRDRYRASGRPLTCFVCGADTNLSLHHRSYKHLGFEEIDDLVVLCDQHHRHVHARAEAGIALLNAHRAVRADYVKVRLHKHHDALFQRTQTAVNHGTFVGCSGQLLPVLVRDDGHAASGLRLILFLAPDGTPIAVRARFPQGLEGAEMVLCEDDQGPFLAARALQSLRRRIRRSSVEP